MDNLEWLKNIEKADDDWNKSHNFNIDRLVEGDKGNEYRIVRALEIIAKELIKHNDISCNLVTTLENIDTALDRS